MPKLREYSGRAITVSFEPGRCIHAAECVKGLPGVFNPDRKPWVEPDAAQADAIAAVVQRCPTGALHYTMAESDRAEAAPATNSVRIACGGPIYIHAKTTWVDGAGKIIVADTRMALCRCGESENKPFCDGRHNAAGFSDPGTVAQDPGNANQAATGDLEIRVVTDGPLLCAGRFEIMDGAGASRGSRESAALCRCGQSENKPFCDGTHSKVGFKAN